MIAALLACNANGPPRAPEKLDSSCWPVVASMRLLTPELGTGKGLLRPITEMTADGALYNLDDTARYRLGMFALIRADALYDSRNKKVLSCVDRALVLGDGTEMSRYDSNDVYLVEHSRLWITSDGTLMRQDWDGPAHSQGRIEGVTLRTRRTAMLLVLAGLGGFPR